MSTPSPASVRLPAVAWRDSIPVRLIAGLLLLTLVSGSIVWWIVARQQERLFAEQTIREQGIRSAEIARAFADRMLGGGGKAVWVGLTAEARELRQSNIALQVQVFIDDGRVMSASDDAAIGTRIQVHGNPECPACDSTHPEDFPASAEVTLMNGARALRIVTPIPVTEVCRFCHKNDHEARSFIAMDFDMSLLERAARERRISILFMGALASVVLVALVMMLFRRLVMRPVESLSTAMVRLAAGELSARASVAGRSELSLLAASFNHMAGQIEEQVARIEAAHTESALLYTLVVGASKSLETSEVCSSVVKVIQEKMRPAHVVFFIEPGEGGWSCMSAAAGQPELGESGSESLDAMLAGAHGRAGRLLGAVPAALVAEVCRTRTLRSERASDLLSFALPVVSEARIIGLLACAGVPGAARIDDMLLENLGAHLTLAVVNSRNYTGAITDALTGLRNKRYGLLRLEDALATARRYGTGQGLCLAMCDIDHFKRINDTWGHPAGDAVLREVSRRIAHCLRRADIVVRYGGEEFLLILPETEPEALPVVGEKILRSVQDEPVSLGAVGGTVPVTVSVGLTRLRGVGDSLDILISRADAALYRAKAAGRNRAVVDY